MARCKKCDARIDAEDKFCPECGGSQKRDKDHQPHAGADRRKVKTLKDRIQYLEELLDDNDIKFEAEEDDEDKD